MIFFLLYCKKISGVTLDINLQLTVYYTKSEVFSRIPEYNQGSFFTNKHA